MNQNRPREVWFIRHAESVANAGGRTREAPTYPLSERGFRQAEQLAGELPLHAELVVVSPYVRARQTAEPYLRNVPAIAVEEWPVQEVQYLDPALCVNTTQDERRVLSQDYWERADADFAAPLAESFVTFVSRAQGALDRLLRRAERATFVFCHGQFISAIAWLILTRPARIDTGAMRRFYQFVHGYSVPNCSVLPVFLHADDSASVGGLWVPRAVDTDMPHLAPPGFAGM
jgi:2,3-bisphosphoglycerate-dependent phosphoglycerate mutase